MEFPLGFQEKITAMLGVKEAEAFFQSYETERAYGLRRNPLKIDETTFLNKMPFALEPVPWVKEGYYYQGQTDQPGKHPYHEAGLYYIQEPSAMSVVEELDPQPGEVICDLCAAPGGKSTQIAGRMQGEGLLVSNEIIPSRAKILSQNIERLGVRNAVVLNETMERMEQFFPSFFDRMVVDAPCSGEGMFRKNEEAVKEWSPEQVLFCAERQSMILNCAAQMLKPGGVLVYSTCTFSPEENELQIEAFLQAHPSFQLEATKRLWPHQVKGEGHFIAKLRKKHETDEKTRKYPQVLPVQASALTEWKAFYKKHLRTELSGTYVLFGEHLYLVPKQMCSLDKMKVVRPGLHLGENKKNRFEPAHALALALQPQEVVQWQELETMDAAQRYLQGNTVECDDDKKGWILMTVEGFSLGWGKAQDGFVKNHYPKGLRKN